MGCKCKEKNQRDTAHAHLDSKLLAMNSSTSPIEGCLYCAEKHLSTAAALGRELGYLKINRGYIIGEIVAACWHLNGTNRSDAIALAEKLRVFRHQIQSRTEDDKCLDYDSYLKEIDVIINKAMTEEKSNA